MSEEIKKLINDSIATVIDTKEVTTEGIVDDATKKIQEFKNDIISRIQDEVGKRFHVEKDMSVGGHLTAIGKKAAQEAKKIIGKAAGKAAHAVDEIKHTVKEHPALAAATAAGLAAGLGGLAAVKKMRNASKKK